MKRNRFFPAVVLAALAFAATAFAQSIPVASSNLSSTITATNTFQLIQGQTNNRIGCTIQNNGSHTMYVYPDIVANATTGGSAVLAPGDKFYCAVSGNFVLKNAISITGTAGDSYF